MKGTSGLQLGKVVWAAGKGRAWGIKMERKGGNETG